MRVAARLLPLLLAVLSAGSGGCAVFPGASPTPTPTATPTVTPTPTPSPTPTPVPQIETPSLEVAQGGTAVLRVRAVAASGVATFEGEQYPLLTKPDGFWAVIGVAADHAVGTFPVAVTMRTGSGRAIAELSASVVVTATGYPVEQIFLAPEESALLTAELSQQEAATRKAVFAAFTPKRLWSGPFIFPVPQVISSTYGIGRSYNGGPVTSFHRGTDFALDEGTPVAAANAGVVAFTAVLPLRGVSVIIDHGGGVFSGYHHLQSAAVAGGQAVAKGDLIGYLGGTGLVTGPHLHWEVIVHGVEVDPVLWTQSEVGP